MTYPLPALRTSFTAVAATSLFLVMNGCASTAPTLPTTYLTTKTPYQAQQAAATYTPAPAGFTAFYTEMVARHGTRGMTSMKQDLALLNLWKQANAEHALTPLGQALGADIEHLMKVHALLGYRVAGITKPGYGNLSAIGIEEHQQLAVRVLQRVPSVFDVVTNSQSAAMQKSIVIQHSGVDRARDSAYFFSQSLTTQRPALASLIEQPVISGYPENAPKAQPAGVNRFDLYFHKLNAKTDLVTTRSDPHLAIYNSSQAYQAYLADPTLNAKLDALHNDPRLTITARNVLGRLFNKEFIDRLDRGELSFANTGKVEFTSADGKYTSTQLGDGKSTLNSMVDVLFAISALYEIAPGLQRELGNNFNAYLPDSAAQLLAYMNDAEDFYTKGPGIAEQNPITYRMADGLLDDFFNEIAAVANGTSQHAAKFRFSHAEIIVPLASRLALPGIFVPVPAAQTYTYENNPWRGQNLAPYAANIQWDVYRNVDGMILVKMLYNEKETDFKSACDAARYAPGSHFYEFNQLKACYAK